MKRPARKIRVVGQADYRAEAESLLRSKGDVAMVIRGRPRTLLIACPDGCGETLSINLDRRMGKAWQVDTRNQEMTLYPSVWRDGGCGSHFIVWRDLIVWCGRYLTENVEPPEDVTLRQRVRQSLDTRRAKTAFEIAHEIDELVWDVERASRTLVATGRAFAHKVNGLNQYLLTHDRPKAF